VKPFPLVIAALVLAWLVLRRKKLSKLQAVLGVVVLAALVVYGTGLVKPPDLETLIEDIGRKLGRWTYVLVGVMTFLETGAFLSFVAPGEFTILFGGLIAGQGRINVIVLIAVVWTCAVLGDTTSFYIGRRLGRNFLLRHGARVKITDERLKQVERYYDRHGGITVFVGRFVGVLRALGPFIAGASKMPYRRFLPYDILGGGLWSTALVLLGYIFWHSFDRLKSTVGRGTFALGTLITVVVGTVWAVRWLRVPENRRKADAWLAAQEEKPLARPFVRALRGVYRHVLGPLGRRALPPARFVYERLTPGRLGLELTTLLAITAVGSFTFIGLAMLVEGAAPHDLDLDALKRATDARTGWGLNLAKALSVLGSLPVAGGVLLVAAVILAARGRWLEALPLVAAGILVYAGVHITKAAVDRPRPAFPLIDASGSSYPSGHAAYAVVYVAVAVAVVHSLPGVARRTALVVAAIVLAVLIGLSRVYLRVHYLTDVAGGFGLGAASFALCGTIALIVAFVRHNTGARGQLPAARATS
jgi:undecaprenyl-diphosphatase